MAEEVVVGVSILHVGVPLDHPVVPVEDRAALRERLDRLQREMRAAGYEYEIVGVDPEGGLEEFKQRLRVQACDAVLLGGGVVGSPELRSFMEQLIDAVHEVTPRAKVLFHSHPEPVRTTVERWFPRGQG